MSRGVRRVRGVSGVSNVSKRPGVCLGQASRGPGDPWSPEGAWWLACGDLLVRLLREAWVLCGEGVRCLGGPGVGIGGVALNPNRK